MITILSTLLGFVASLAPEIFSMVREKQDRRHELDILRIQKDLANDDRAERLEEVRIGADIKELRILHKPDKSGIRWIDALNGTVRPVLAYGFFLLYCAVKGSQIYIAIALTDSFFQALDLVWTVEDNAIFTTIIAFYFGSRAMQKIRNS